jgi:1-aminocyclopropane-1-carboxylate deaminase/D-cysteine desulfhydrase-like pyridoxal-dependent ACC family enzyme
MAGNETMDWAPYSEITMTAYTTKIHDAYAKPNAERYEISQAFLLADEE